MYPEWLPSAHPHCLHLLQAPTTMLWRASTSVRVLQPLVFAYLCQDTRSTSCQSISYKATRATFERCKWDHINARLRLLLLFPLLLRLCSKFLTRHPMAQPSQLSHRLSPFLHLGFLICSSFCLKQVFLGHLKPSMHMHSCTHAFHPWVCICIPFYLFSTHTWCSL